MRKFLLYALLFLALISLCFGCSASGDDYNNDVTQSATASVNAVTASPAPLPSPTALPVLKPVKILADTQCIIKIYDNGEFGYIGKPLSKSKVEFNQQRAIEDSITCDMIEAKIPLVLEDWEYSNYSQNGLKPGFAYILKSELNQEEYDSQYGDMLNEIKSKYVPKQIDEITSITDLQVVHWGNAYLVNTEKQQGIVFAETNIMNDKLMQSVYCFVADPFDGVTVTDVALGSRHVIGLTEDGRVLGYLIQNAAAKDFGQTNTSDWTDIVDVAAGYNYTVALKQDGTVLACGDNQYRQCDVSEWKDITAVEAAGFYTFGLKSDGTVVTTGNDPNFKFDVSGWSDIVELKVCNDIVAGLRRDGTVVISGALSYNDFKWDTSRGPILSDIVSINLIGNMFRNKALIALNSKGEFFIVNIYDYITNYSDFTTGIDDIAATGEADFAVLKGEQILYSSPNAKTGSWDSILKNEGRYAYKPFERNRVAELTDTGELKVSEAYSAKREGIFTYPSKITKVCVISDDGSKFVLLAENGDVVFVEISDDNQDTMKFESTVLFDSEKEQTKAVKVYQNSLFCAYLDENGNLHYPEFLQLRIMKEFRHMNWDEQVNWNRDTQNPSENAQN